MVGRLGRLSFSAVLLLELLEQVAVGLVEDGFEVDAAAVEGSLQGVGAFAGGPLLRGSVRVGLLASLPVFSGWFRLLILQVRVITLPRHLFANEVCLTSWPEHHPYLPGLLTVHRDRHLNASSQS